MSCLLRMSHPRDRACSSMLLWSQPLRTLAACWLLASCATAPHAPGVPPPGTQALLVRTDPAGATCLIRQNAVVVAAVPSTPGTANLPVVFGGLGSVHVEDVPPFEVECNKPDYLSSRMTFAVQAAETVSAEGSPAQDPSSAKIAGAAGSAVAVGAAGGAASMGAMGALAAAPILLPVAAVGLLVAMAAKKTDTPPRYDYAYRPLPELLLTPSTFGSESDCDAHFASLEKRLQTTRDAQRSDIDANCRFWPCKASDAAPCPDPVCERRRAVADAQLKSQLDQIPSLRAQARIVPP